MRSRCPVACEMDAFVVGEEDEPIKTTTAFTLAPHFLIPDIFSLMFSETIRPLRHTKKIFVGCSELLELDIQGKNTGSHVAVRFILPLSSFHSPSHRRAKRENEAKVQFPPELNSELTTKQRARVVVQQRELIDTRRQKTHKIKSTNYIIPQAVYTLYSAISSKGITRLPLSYRDSCFSTLNQLFIR
ncbi:hypothetical protein Ocin01_03413 [Orchesella cincta]|uniref:Uncharacterized protein n=1 Tax=Orchesella cincta TaxID=48709 RepID=A0A1D2NDE8_ORCCI|nr:hypothetical protein Ocin01_03413 [Orchesella cincta]